MPLTDRAYRLIKVYGGFVKNKNKANWSCGETRNRSVSTEHKGFYSPQPPLEALTANTGRKKKHEPLEGE